MAENIREILRTYTSKLEDSNKFAKPSDLNTKQDILISSVNIKTIHNQSILGEGNIEVVGPIGPTGLQGEQGPQGVQGEQGPKGNTGDTGAKGPTGDKGDPGNPGPTGAIGPTGLQGAVGPTGANGKDGTGVSILGSYNTLSDLQAAHPTGNAGDAYLVGTDLYVWSSTTNTWVDVGRIQGPQGEKGDKGDPGNTGPTGVTGPTGPTGATGPQGEQGEQGPKGEQGIQGPQGIQGITGPQGETGPIGPTGLTGSQGPTGTVWIVGSSAPQFTTVGRIGDLYLNTSNGDLYRLSSISSYPPGSTTNFYIWDLQNNIKGPQGSIGPTGPTGTVIVANPTITGTANTLTSIKIGTTDYKIEGIAVAANPPTTTNSITGITIDTINYKIIIDDGEIAPAQ